MKDKFDFDCVCIKIIRKEFDQKRKLHWIFGMTNYVRDQFCKTPKEVANAIEKFRQF